jgi:hypothetical protein
MNDLRAAAQQALEALELCRDWPGAYDECSSAIAALRTALAQQEPRNQCGETCERAKLCAVCARGLEHEPLSVEDLARALVASRVIDPAAIDDPEGYDDGVMLERVRGLHRRLAALAQQQEQEQEPVIVAVAAERERCAKIADDYAARNEETSARLLHPMQWVAKQIRRGR